MKGSSLCHEPRFVRSLAPTDLTDASRKAANYALYLTKLNWEEDCARMAKNRYDQETW